MTGGGFRWSGGTLSGSTINSTFTNQGSFTAVTSAATALDYNVLTTVNSGTIADTGTGLLQLGGATINNQAVGVIDVQSDGNIAGGGTTLNNAGTVRKSGGTGTSTVGTGTMFLNNTGTVEAQSGTLSIAPSQVTQLSGTTLTGGTWAAQDGAKLVFPSEAALNTNQGNIVLDGAGATIAALEPLATNSGSLALSNGATFTTTGNLSNSGTLAIGTGSTLTVDGALTQTSSGTLSVQLGAPPASGQLVATGAATLAGTLQATTAAGYIPAVGDSFTVGSYASHTGTFATLDLASNSTTFFSAAVNPTAVVPAAPRRR